MRVADDVQEQLGEFEAAWGVPAAHVKIEEAAYGPEHHEVAITLTSVGSPGGESGEIDAARVILKRATSCRARRWRACLARAVAVM